MIALHLSNAIRIQESKSGSFKMVPLILTGLAGVALGVVIMRLLQQQSSAQRTSATPETAASDSGSLDPTPAGGILGGFSKAQLAFGGAAGLAALSVGIIAFRPSDSASSSAAIGAAPSTAAPGTPGGAALDDVDTMITRLATRLKTDTTDGDGFRMLGWSYVNTAKPVEAVTAYIRAEQLLPNRADVHAGYGEALVAVAKDVVTPEAKAQFDKAIALDPKEPRARFFASLYKAQHGDEKAALEEWIALSNSASPDQPWQGDVHQRVEKLAAKLGVSIAGRLKAPAAAPATALMPSEKGGPDAATVKAASSLSEGERQGMINGMVDGLAAKLQANPGDVDGWIKLIRSRVVLKDMARAKDDLGMARKALASNPAKLGAINSVATELGL
jgi:cytochrome c-type biogenesis protein CcmH